MRKPRGWALGVLALAAAGALVGGGHPGTGSRVTAGAVAAKPPVIKLSAAGNGPVPITWAQAQATFPTMASQPGWLPPGTAHSSLVYDGHGQIDAYWMGPQYQWTLDITYNTGTETDNVAPNQTLGTIGGIPAMIAAWYATPGGAYITNVSFQWDGNTYNVNGINLSLAVAEHVAVSLIHP